MSWCRHPVKHLAEVSVSNVDKKSAVGEIPVRLVNYTDVYYGDRLVPSPGLMEATASPRQIEVFRLRRGDVVITKDSETAEDIGVPAYVEASADDMVLGYHLALLRPRQRSVDGRYLYWAMCSDDARGQLSTGATGVTRFGLRTDVIRSSVISAPSAAEQRAIADFLDIETTRIDSLITKKRRLVELTLERLRARVRETTRRGVRGNMDLRDSGLPWVGEIPADWRVAPNRSLFVRRQDQVGPLHDDIALLSLTRRGVIVRDVSDNRGKFPASFDTYQHVSPGQLVFCLFDIPETPRTVGLAHCEGMVTGAYSVFEVPHASAKYLTYLYQGFDDEKSLSLWYTGLRNVIRPSTFLNMRCPLPPRAEQDEIAAALEFEQEQATQLVARLERQLALLQERRQALITAAVTGELEVPGVAA